MKVAVVGAGFSGLVAARVLREVGLDVVVYEQDGEVGGVWSPSRHYPGLSTQNDKDSYALSELPMPKHYPEFPSGPQVAAYLQNYVDTFALGPLLQLGHEVVSADLDDAGGWSLTIRDPGGGVTLHRVDHLVVANGVYSQPRRPDWSGADEFEAAGGKILATSDLSDVDTVRNRSVVVVGDGKSASDIAVAVSAVASSTHVVARRLRWKVPKQVGGRVKYQYLLLTRLGENLFRYRGLRGTEGPLHGVADRVRRRLLDGLRGVIVRQLQLGRLGLVPDADFADVASARAALVTDGYYDRVADGTLTVLRDRSIARLGAADAQSTVELSDGTSLSADLLIVATGHRQQVPFLPSTIRKALVDDDGDFRLYRNVLPLAIPHLSFVGYNQSFFSPLSAEIASIWLASLLTGRHHLPSATTQAAETSERLRWSRQRTGGHHSSGANITPFSMHNIDELLNDLHLNIGPLARAKQWLLPVSPSVYRNVLQHLARR